jgi:hypothetical protein
MLVGIAGTFALIAFIVAGVIWTANTHPDASDTHN